MRKWPSLIKAQNVDVWALPCYSVFMSEYEFSQDAIHREALAVIESNRRIHAEGQARWDALDRAGALSYMPEHVAARLEPKPLLTPERALMDAQEEMDLSQRAYHADLSRLPCGEDDAVIDRAQGAHYYGLVMMEVYFILRGEELDRE